MLMFWKNTLINSLRWKMILLQKIFENLGDKPLREENISTLWNLRFKARSVSPDFVRNIKIPRQSSRALSLLLRKCLYLVDCIIQSLRILDTDWVVKRREISSPLSLCWWLFISRRWSTMVEMSPDTRQMINIIKNSQSSVGISLFN